MQRILGMMRRAAADYHMLEDGDRVALGVSGGKDSVALLAGMARLRKFIGIDFELEAVTLDPMFGGAATDYSPIAALCRELGVPYRVQETNIGFCCADMSQ